MGPAWLQGKQGREQSRVRPLHKLGEAWRRLRFRRAVRKLSKQISVDVSEDARAYVVLASVPGVAREDILVTLDRNCVHISTCASVEHEEHDVASLPRRERYVGRRDRTLLLAQEVDPRQASAEFRHGMLKLELPKVDRPSGVKVTVH
jgi:HSP20 family protein